MVIQGQVGPQTSVASLGPSQQTNVRLGNMGDLIASELHGRYYEAAYRKTKFGGIVIGQVTTVGLATTYTGLCLSNPNGSGINLILEKVGIGFTVVFPAASVIGLLAGFSGTNVTQTTPVTPKNKFVGGPSGVGLLASAATLQGTPYLDTVFGAGLTGATTTLPYVLQLIDLEGGLVIPPGGYVAIYTSTITGAAGGNFSFDWEEVPA